MKEIFINVDITIIVNVNIPKKGSVSMDKTIEERKYNLEKTLKHLEFARHYLMREYNLLGFNDEAIRRTTVYPMAKVKPLIINDYPVMHFAYDGALPIFDKTDPEYNIKVRHYYFLATFDSYNFDRLLLPVFTRATIIFVHYFDHMNLGDLDNRNTKYIQDAIKLTKIIKDDNWENVWTMNMGFYDEERSHVQVYVVEQQNTPEFLKYLFKNHEGLKIPADKTRCIGDYEGEFIRYQKEQRKKTEENRQETLDQFKKNITDDNPFIANENSVENTFNEW